MRQGRPADAREAARRAIGVGSGDATALLSAATLLAALGEPAEALLALHRAVELAPNFAATHRYLGAVLLDVGEVESGIASLRRALALKQDPADRAVVQVLLGNGLLTLGDADGALAAYRQAFQAQPGSASDARSGWRYNAACAAVRVGPAEFAQALDWLRADLDALDNMPVAEAGSVVALLAHGKTDEDLAAVRDADDLPAGDLSAEFRKLWADVDALLARARKAAPN